MPIEARQVVSRIGKLFRDGTETDLHSYREQLERINRWESEISAVDNGQLRQWALRLKERVRNGAPVDSVRDELFALSREAAERVLGQRPYDEQMLAGLAMHQGRVVEMQTGEGKTLAAVAPVALNALGGAGVHVLTFNDYLARRDARWMGPVYECLGLTVGCVQEGIPIPERRQAYARDITYLTAREAGFDYLRAHLCLESDELVQRPFRCALVDEADSILIDEARIPLVIAGSEEDTAGLAVRAAAVARQLERHVHFDTDEHARNIFLTEAGSDRVEKSLDCGNLYEAKNLGLLADVRNALHAEYLLERDVDYIVRNGGVELVDDFTGRVAEKRQWPDGLQAAVEAKECLTLKDEGRVLGSITMQHFMRIYPRLCGMTATARAAADKLREFYSLEVVIVPPHRKNIRVDHSDLIFTHKEAKLTALVREIRKESASGRPILVGTASVVESEQLASLLSDAGVSLQVLNAKNDELEAEIVAEAGAPGAVTISTNMAGRGTDIKLGGKLEEQRDRVLARGGLYVIGTNRHESLRVDQQLRGRAGRQGDPGASRFFISLEDPLLQRYGIEDLIPAKRRPPKRPEPVHDRIVNHEVARAQRIIEGENAAIRRRLFDYSDLVEQQRQTLQGWRQQVLLDRAPLGLLARSCPERYERLTKSVGEEKLRSIEKRLTLLAIDRGWCDHLAEVQRVKHGIHVANLIGKNPLAEFYREIGGGFQHQLPRIDEEIVTMFESIQVTAEGVDWEKERLVGPSATWTYMVSDDPSENNPMRSLAHRPGHAFWGAIALGPLLFLYGLVTHWQRRKKRKEDQSSGAASRRNEPVSMK